MARPGPIRAALLGLASLAALAVPARAAANFSPIDAALAAGDSAGALGLIDAAMAQANVSDAEHGTLLLDRGLADKLGGHSNAALADLTAAIEAHGLNAQGQARALMERGLLLDAMGRLDDAAGDYGAVLRLTPGAPAALNNRANVLRRQGKLDAARRDYLASLAGGNPQPEYSYYGLGQIAESQGDEQGARAFYAKAVAADPSYGLAAGRLAALGGAPAAAAADDSPIHLHPPPGMASSGMAGQGRIVLRPPGRRTPPVAARTPVAQADNTAPPLGLRPALDNRAKSNGPGNGQVQLGAWRSASEAALGWNRAVRQAEGLLDGISPHIVTADLPGRGRYYRLRVGPVAGQSAAQFCAALAAKGQDCIPARD